MGIRTKITVGMLVGAILPLALFWGISYGDSRTRVVDGVKAQLSAIVTRQALHVEDWLDTSFRGVKLAAADPALAGLDPAAAKGATQRLVANYPWFVAAFVAQANGQQVARSNDEALSNIAEREYFRAALAGNLAPQVAISKANNQPVLLFAAPVAGSSGAPVGALGVSAELKTISDMVVADKVGSSGFSFLLDRSGKLVAHPDKAKIGASPASDSENFMNHPAVKALSSGNASFVSFEKDGKQWVGAAAKTNSGWIMVTQMEEDEAFAPVRDLNVNALTALAAAVVVALLLSFLLGKKLSGPIVLLTGIADEISRGEFHDEKLDAVPQGDEIGDLAAAVKRLSASVKLAMEMLTKAD